MEMRSDLGVRIVSGIAIAVPCLLAVYVGGPWLAAAASLVAALIAWEWQRLTAPDPSWTHWAFVAACGLAPWASVAGGWPAAFALVGIAATLGWTGRRPPALIWSTVGALAAALAPAALVQLRGLPDGLVLVSWVVGVVVASDVGAYTAGRALGGPKMAPRISPGKTWSGAIGGLLSAGAVGAIIGSQFSILAPAYLLVLSLAAGATAQAGDLGASALKRWAGVKDSGRLIPGHGGAIDRFDSLVAVVLVAALAVSVAGLNRTAS